MKKKKRHLHPQKPLDNQAESLSSSPHISSLHPRKSQYAYRSNILKWGMATLIAVITFLVYLPSLQNGFVNWDDHLYVYENLYIRSIDFRLLKWIPEVVIWHPLTMLSLAVDYTLWSYNPLGYHLTNNFIHASSTFLVFILSFRLVERDGLGNPKGVLITSFVTALLFGIHPLHVESVAWVSERKDVLCAFFFLLSLLAYLKYISMNPGREKSIRYSISILFFGFALLSKPMAVTLPLVLLILDFYPLNRLYDKASAKNVILEKVPFVILSIILSAITIWTYYGGNASKIPATHPFVGRITLAIWSYLFYLIKIIFPIDLAPLYSYPGEVVFTANHIISFIILVTISVICVRALKSSKLFFTVLLYYLITLIPVIGIIQAGISFAADRNTYLPSIAPFLLAGLGVKYLFERYAKYQIALIAVLISLTGTLMYKTINQIDIWHDSVSLWTHEIRLFPTEPAAYNNRGNAYKEQGYLQEALMDYDKAIELKPRYAEAYNNRGIIYYRLGNHEQALMNYNKAIELNPTYAISYNNRGALYDSLGNYDRAIADYNDGIKANPRFIDAYYNRGIAYNNIGNYQQAIIDFNAVIRLNPDDFTAYNLRGYAYGALGDYEQALRDTRVALEINPVYADAYNKRGLIYKILSRYQEALREFNRAIEINPQFVEVYINRGSVYDSVGNQQQAIADFKKAIDLDPQYKEAYFNLGVAYSKSGEMELSVASYKKAANLGMKEAEAYLRR